MESMTALLQVGVQAQPEAVGVDPGLRGQDPHGQLLPGHLQAEDAAGLAGLRSVDRHVDGQAALSHGGTGAQDDQVGPLQPAEVFIQVREPGHYRQPAGLQCGGNVRLLLQVLVVDVLQRDEVAGLPGAPDGEQGFLGLPHGGLHVVRVGVAELHDPVAGVDQPPHA